MRDVPTHERKIESLQRATGSYLWRPTLLRGNKACRRRDQQGDGSAQPTVNDPIGLHYLANPEAARKAVTEISRFGAGCYQETLPKTVLPGVLGI